MAATPTFSARLILEQADDTGQEASKDLDKSFPLSGLETFTCAQRIKLGASSTYTISVTDYAALVVVSHDKSFKVRIKAAEHQIVQTMLFALASEGITKGISTEDVILEGNGSNEANLEIWVVEKTT